jgi:hypothetical protein
MRLAAEGPGIGQGRLNIVSRVTDRRLDTVAGVEETGELAEAG